MTGIALVAWGCQLNPLVAQGLFQPAPEGERATTQEPTVRTLFPQFSLSPPDADPSEEAAAEDAQGSTGQGTIPSAASADRDGVIAEVTDPVTTDPETAPNPEAATQSAEAPPAAADTPTAVVPPLRPQTRPETTAQTAPTLAPRSAATGPICGTAVRDPDIARNAQVLRANPTLCVAQESVTEHGRQWSLVTITDIARRRGPRWAVLHDNEDAAFDAAIYALTRYGGAMIAVDGSEARTVQGQDPNRNFGLTSQITAPCGGMRSKPAPEFTRALNRQFLRRPLVLSLHSNHDGHEGDGADGTGDISAARSTATRRGFLSTAPVEGLSDPDNAILIAGLEPYENTPTAQDLVAHMSPLGINVIYEQVTTETNDCSLSAHAVLNKMGDYYNIEVEHGRIEDQKVILDALMAYLGVEAAD